jgi:septum formation protein
MSDSRLILASASPRRGDLLDQLGVSYSCDPTHIDESRETGEDPQVYVQRMAHQKVQAVANRYNSPGFVVLGADTTVVLEGAVLGKPRDKADALDILARLSGRSHSVFTAVCLWSTLGERSKIVETTVEFIALSPEVCEAYVATGESCDKAGAYAIQGLGGAFVRAIVGSYSNVVGLPLCETWQLLQASGIATALNSTSDA